jgi:predicted nucleic acid-binding protein
MIAVDTNVLIYCCDEGDARRQKIALDLVTSARDGLLLWQVAGEFIAASRKLGAQGFSAAAAWARLADFLELFPLVLPTPQVLVHARRLHSEQQVAFWDAMLLGACLEAGVTRLYSEDLPSPAKADSLEIVNPFA